MSDMSNGLSDLLDTEKEGLLPFSEVFESV